MGSEDKKGEKGFGEGIEVVKDQPKEEKDIEINFGSVLSFFKKKDNETAAPAEHKDADKAGHHTPHDGKAQDKHAKGHDSSKLKQEEAEIDLGKFASGIKGMFKGKEKAEAAAGKDDDEVALNPKSIIDFLNKRGALLLLLLGIIVSVGLTAHVRYTVGNLGFTEEWAQNTVYNIIQSDIQNAIDTQYPNLPDARKSQILSDELNKAMGGGTYIFKSSPYAGQQINIESQIKGTAEDIKGFYKDENGQAYSPDIDPYYWNRYAENILQEGHIGDEVRNGVQWDNHQLAPDGRPVSAQDTFFPNLLAALYKVARFFSHSITLWNVQTIIYPMLINGLSVLMVFLIGRKIAGNVGGFFGSLMAGLHSAYVGRTIHGDNDAIVMFFAILTMWLFVEAMYARKTMFRLAIAALAGLAAGLFSLNWGGWWFIFIFLLITSAVTITTGIIIRVLNPDKSGSGLKSLASSDVVKGFLIPTAVFFFATALFVSLFNGIDRFLATPLLALGITKLKTAVLAQSYWPNVLTTVAELNPGSFNQLISSVKPGIFWTSALSAVILTALAVLNIFPAARKAFSKALKSASQDENKALRHIFFATLIIIWFIGTIYASYKGVRFVVMIMPAVGLGFGITLGFIFRFATWLNDNYLKIQKTAVAVVVFLVLATTVYSTGFIKDAYVIANHDIPIMNDAWYDSLKAIQSNSTPTAIITSWWDFGHHFKAIAERGVTFDGTTQQGPQAHWVGKFFMTENETHAAGILRMLDCGSNHAFDEVNKAETDFHSAIDIVTRLTTIPSKAEAKSVLTKEYKFTDAQAESVLNYTHCDNPPEGYVIASEDMIGKSGVWGHFGSWDFERAIIWQTLRNKNQKDAVDAMVKDFNYSEEKAKSVYNEMRAIRDDAAANIWIAPWPSYLGSTTGCQEQASEILCAPFDLDLGGGRRITLQLHVNATTDQATYQTPDGNVLVPPSFVHIKNNTVVTERYANSTFGISPILIPQESNYVAAYADPATAGGTFTKMYYFGGEGLNNFKLLAHNRGITGTNVYVYKAQWDTLK